MSIEEEGGRARLADNLFAPINGTPEQRRAHAAEYTAYYLGEIVRHLNDLVLQKGEHH